MNTPNNGSGAWIFVSHSNKDIEKVREIRNELESLGHNPVLFYLKCMEDTESDDELLWKLIEREIRAREWFLICDSPDAQSSKSVMREMNLVKSMEKEGKVVETINLERGLQFEQYKLTRLSKRATIFLSYSNQDIEIAHQIIDYLSHEGFSIYYNHDNHTKSDWINSIAMTLEYFIQNGYVLLLINRAFFENPFCLKEIVDSIGTIQKSQRQSILLVSLVDLNEIMELLPNHEEHVLSKLQWFDLSSGHFKEGMSELVRILRTAEIE